MLVQFSFHWHGFVQKTAIYTWMTKMSKLLIPSMSSLGLTLVTSWGFKNLRNNKESNNNIYIHIWFSSKTYSIPAEVDLGVGVTVIQDHGEELSGRLQGGLLIHLVRWICQLLTRSAIQLSGSNLTHLKADGAAVGEIASGGVKLAHGAHLHKKSLQNLQMKTWKKQNVKMKTCKKKMRDEKGCHLQNTNQLVWVILEFLLQHDPESEAV